MRSDIINIYPNIGALLLLYVAAGPVSAGGVDFSPDEFAPDAGSPYLGIVVDQSGAPLPDAKITVSVAKLNVTVVLRSDQQGHFFFQGFDKSTEPDDVKIMCGKDGYVDAQAIQVPATDASAPVQVTCVLPKKN